MMCLHGLKSLERDFFKPMMFGYGIDMTRMLHGRGLYTNEESDMIRPRYIA